MEKRIWPSLLALWGLAIFLLVAGCGEGKNPSEEPSGSTSESGQENSTPADVSEGEFSQAGEDLPHVSAKALEKLMMADQVDGTRDNVVHKCPGCSLLMDGSTEHAMHVAGYEIQFCSETCKGFFALDAESNIEIMHNPDGE